ncbi:MAG TPA: hypothetical protein VKP69_22125 [Isosphaeraceae bacterium]|nr:hypothetical protein [Isosphaeraceae bacterium]
MVQEHLSPVQAIAAGLRALPGTAQAFTSTQAVTLDEPDRRRVDPRPSIGPPDRPRVSPGARRVPAGATAVARQAHAPEHGVVIDDNYFSRPAIIRIPGP